MPQRAVREYRRRRVGRAQEEAKEGGEWQRYNLKLTVLEGGDLRRPGQQVAVLYGVAEVLHARRDHRRAGDGCRRREGEEARGHHLHWEKMVAGGVSR